MRRKVLAEVAEREAAEAVKAARQRRDVEEAAEAAASTAPLDASDPRVAEVVEAKTSWFKRTWVGSQASRQPPFPHPPHCLHGA